MKQAPPMTTSSERLSEAQIKKRIRYRIAMEVRSALSEPPDALHYDQPPEVVEAWQVTVWDIAEKIWPSDRNEPAGRRAVADASPSHAKES